MSEYVRIAHKHAGVEALQRFLMDRYVNADVPAKETLIAETVFYADREVTQDALMELFHDLTRWENDLRARMSAYQWRTEDSPLAFLQNDAPKPAEAKKKDGPEAPERKAQKRKRGKSGTEGSGNTT